MTKSWKLDNAEERARSYPYTFYKPSLTVLRQLKKGNTVKLIFLFENEDPEAPRAERMWVEIIKMKAGRYQGILINQPEYIQDLNLGDKITFEDKHIIDTEFKDPEPNLVEKYIKKCFVNKKVLYESAKVGYLYREEPDNDKDSGWRIMVGNETQEYVDNPDNWAFVSLGAVLTKDDSFITVLDAPTRTAFERNSTTGDFEEIEFEPSED